MDKQMALDETKDPSRDEARMPAIPQEITKTKVSTTRDFDPSRSTRLRYEACSFITLLLVVVITTMILRGTIGELVQKVPTSFRFSTSARKHRNPYDIPYRPGLGTAPHPIYTPSPVEAQQMRHKYSPPTNDTLDAKKCTPRYDDRGFPEEHPRWHEELQMLYARAHERIPAVPPLWNRSMITYEGARLVCWPSTGGIWIKRALLADLDFLDMSTTADTSRPLMDTVGRMMREEDEFCRKMRQVGANFYELPSAFSQNSHCNCRPLETCLDPTYQNKLGFAWGYNYNGHVFELEKTRERYGLGLNGYYIAPLMTDRLNIAKEFDTTINCRLDWQECKRLWCDQYEQYCGEYRKLADDHPTSAEQLIEWRMQNPGIYL